MKKKKEEEITGQSITGFGTVNSMYAQGLIRVAVNGDWSYRINVDELLKVMNDNVKITLEKKRTYKHLTIREVEHD